MLPTYWSQDESFTETAVAALCAFSIANPVLAQAARLVLSDSAGGLAMQGFQGLCFLGILVTLPRLSRGRIELTRPFSRLVWLYVIGLGFLHLRLLSAGRIPGDMLMTERVVYFKFIFALVLWYYVSCLVQSQARARRLLRAILIGALISAVWILVCYVSGMGSANYASSGVKATAGSEGISGKAMAGFMLPAAAGALLFALRENSYRWALGASLLLVAVFVTFDRSSQVACATASLWLVVWWVFLARPKPSSKIILVTLGVIVALGSVYLVHQGIDELMARWTTDFDRGEVGSGRGMFYTTAWNWFWSDSNLADFLMGIGYGNIEYLMHAGSGIYRHTHSDFFDMLLIGGVSGLVLYFLLYYTVASLTRGLYPGSPEFGLLGAIVVAFGVMGLLTGLMGFPHTLYAFGAQCICIRGLAIEDAPYSAPSFAAGTPGFTNLGFSDLA
jgi:hypothetical protein